MTTRATAWTGRGPLSRPAVDRAVDDPAPIVALVGPAGFGKTVALQSAARRRGRSAVVINASAGADVFDQGRLATRDSGLVLFDDVHLLGGDRSNDLAQFVQDVVAGGGRVLLASRTTLALPLLRWQIEGTAEVVTSRELTFDEATLSDFFDMDGPKIQSVIDTTHGWPSAVALLARRLKKLPLEEALAAAHADHVSYVAAEALSVLDADELDLLRKVSILDRLEDAVVAQVTGDHRAPHTLREITERTQLLEPTSHGHPAWRADVRAALRRELVELPAVALPGLHLAAAAALSMNRRQVAARLQHLLQAEAWDLAVGLVATRWGELINLDQFDMLAGAAAAIPVDTVAADPVLSLSTGAVLLMSGQLASAEACLEAATVNDDPAAAATAATLRAHATWWSTAPQHALAHLDAVESFLHGEPYPRLLSLPGFETLTSGLSTLSVSRARALALADDVGQASELLRVLDTLPASDPVARSVGAWATKAWVDALAGELVEASAACGMAFSLAQDGGWSGTAALAPAHLARALIVARSGASTDTWHDLADTAEMAIRARAWGLLRTTQAVAAMCGHIDRPLPAPASEVVAHVPLADRVLAAWHSHRALGADDSRTAATILATTVPSQSALCPWTEVSLAVHGPERTTALVAGIAPPATAAAAIDRLLVDASLAREGAGRDELLRAAVSEARSKGLEGLLRSYPGDPCDLLAATEGDERVDALLAGPTHGPAQTADLVLSEREHEILRLLDGPLTINEIGPEVYLSAHTVKWHAARIYRKLQVHTRSAALDRARRLGLLPVAPTDRPTDSPFM